MKSRIIVTLVFAVFFAFASFACNATQKSEAQNPIELIPPAVKKITWDDIKSHYLQQEKLDENLDLRTDPGQEIFLHHVTKTFYPSIYKHVLEDGELAIVKARLGQFLDSLRSLGDNSILASKYSEKEDRADVLEILGTDLSSLNVEEVGLLWFRATLEMLGQEGRILGSTLQTTEAVRILEGGRFLPGIGSIDACAKQVKAQVLKASKIGNQDGEQRILVSWRESEYEAALWTHMEMLERADKKEYFNFLVKYFPFQNGSVSDYIEVILDYVVNSPEYTSAQKKQLVDLTNQRLNQLTAGAIQARKSDYHWDRPFTVKELILRRKETN